MSTDYAQQVIDKAISMLGEDIKALLILTPEENKMRRNACKAHVLEDGLYPLKYGEENHISYALEAFKSFDGGTKKEFLQAYRALTFLNTEIEAAEEDGRIGEMRSIRSLENTLYPATQLRLYEEEARMVKNEGATKESITHASMYIIKTPSLVKKFEAEYEHQLQGIASKAEAKPFLGG